MNFKSTTARARMAGAVMGVCLPLCMAHAGETFDPFAPWHLVPDRELAELRGGFITANGLEINIGLEQLVLIDGSLKTQLNLNLSDLERGAGGVQSGSGDQSRQIQLIQNGSHNMVATEVPAQFSSGALTVIQNSLDAQLIQNLTLLNIDVSRISQIRSGALGEAINLELVRALR